MVQIAYIYFPTTIYNNIASKDIIDKVFNTVINRIIDTFGVSTVTNGTGYYKSQSGEVIKEDIRIIQIGYEDAYSDSDSVNTFYKWIIQQEKLPSQEIEDIARYIKAEMKQECVTVIINNTMRFI